MSLGLGSEVGFEGGVAGFVRGEGDCKGEGDSTTVRSASGGSKLVLSVMPS